MFPAGDTTVTCRGSDAAQRSASCTFVVTVALPAQLRYTRYVAFGDSITEGKVSDPILLMRLRSLFRLEADIPLDALQQALVDGPESYPTGLQRRLSERYRQQSFTVTNAGFAGEYAAPGDAPSGVIRFPSVLAAYDPQVVLLMEGTNDMLNASGPAPALAALDAMIGLAVAQGRRVCLATLPPQRDTGRRPGAPSRVPPFNQGIQMLAAKWSIPLVDVYDAMKDDVPHLIGADDLHPTERGYAVIADAFFDTIRMSFEETPATTAASTR